MQQLSELRWTSLPSKSSLLLSACISHTGGRSNLQQQASSIQSKSKQSWCKAGAKIAKLDPCKSEQSWCVANDYIFSQIVP